jgi:hypothetical protein
MQEAEEQGMLQVLPSCQVSSHICQIPAEYAAPRQNLGSHSFILANAQGPSGIFTKIGMVACILQAVQPIHFSTQFDDMACT